MSRALSDLNDAVRQQCETLLGAARDRGHKLVVTQTLRSWGDQQTLYNQGRSSPGPIVTAAPGGYSWHNFGLAFDVAFDAGEGKVSWDGPWELIGDLGEAIGLEWGGRWKHMDKPHFENRKGMSLAIARLRYSNGAMA